MIRTSHQSCSVGQIEKNQMGETCSQYGKREVHAGILVGKLKDRDCLEDPASKGR